jgi:hypothetical protein
MGLTTGCTVQEASPKGTDGGTGSATTAPPPGTSCLQVLQCIVNCADTDTACPDACNDKGTPEAKGNVEALAKCIDTEKCQDGDCTKAKCATEIDACIASSAPKSNGEKLSGTAPPGSVPTDLVGTWAGARDGITERLIFNADGTGSWTSSNASQESACFNYVKTVREGTVVITDTTITVYATSVVQQEQRCSPPTIDTQQPAVTEKIDWHRADGNPNQILIIDSACAAKYPNQENCNIAGCPIGLYCTSRLNRE